MNKKMTLSIGIPAHNEEKNIGYLIKSIFKQLHDSYELEKIHIVCDGCTDNTSTVVRRLQQVHPEIVLVDDGKRKGKAIRLNEIYSLNSSELLLTIDADTIFKTKFDLEKLVIKMLKNKDALIVGPRYEPVWPHSLMGKFAYYSYITFEDAIFKLNKGRNIYALMGCCTLIRKNLSKSFKYPAGVISDQNYIYLMAKKENENGFEPEFNVSVLFRPVETFKDWRILSVRSVYDDKRTVKEFFGEDVLKKEYFMPKKYYFFSLLKWLVKNPIYTVGAIAMNIFIRLFPYKKYATKNGIWQMTRSSKIGIIL